MDRIQYKLATLLIIYSTPNGQLRYLQSNAERQSEARATLR